MPSDSPTPLPAAPRRSSCLAVLLTLVVLLGASMLLLLLPIGFIGSTFVFVSVVFIGLLGFHYLVWGRLLSRELTDADPSSHDETE